MGNMFFVPFHPHHAKELGSNRAELLFEYLTFCQAGNDGVRRSTNQIERELGLTRTMLTRAKKILVEKGWIRYEVETMRSPTARYWVTGQKVINQRDTTEKPITERDKDIARQRVHRAVLKGVMTKRPCEVCNTNGAEAHHPDYRRPLDVVWLCQRHHSDVHHQLRRSNKLST
jgi:DNA-binding HxlR family transcriptional regulator